MTMIPSPAPVSTAAAHVAQATTARRARDARSSARSTGRCTSHWQRMTAGAVLAASLCAGLGGCVPLIVGGGALTAVMVASDRRTTGMQVEDERIEQIFSAQAMQQMVGARTEATSFNRIVLLTGEVRTEAERQRASDLAQRVPNVRSVINELAVVPVISTLGQRSSDTLTTTRVKAGLVNAQDLDANSIKVITELNVVYLMGIVNEREAHRAAEVARSVGGVRKVVRVFEVLTDGEIAALRTRQANPSGTTITTTTTAPAQPAPAPTIAPAPVQPAPVVITPVN